MRGCRIALIASLIVNLFLVGVLAGGAFWLHRGRPMIAAGALRIAGSELQKDERRAFRAALRQARQSERPALQESRAQRLRAAALLRQPSLDQPAILDALAHARAADIIVRSAVETRAVTFAATLPPADRVALADAMEGRVQNGRRVR